MKPDTRQRALVRGTNGKRGPDWHAVVFCEGLSTTAV